MSHWWQQEGHPAKIAAVCQLRSYLWCISILVGTSKPLNKGSPQC